MAKPDLPEEVQNLFAREGEWANTQKDLFFFICDCDKTASCRCQQKADIDVWVTYCNTPGCKRHGMQEVITISLSKEDVAQRKQYAKQIEKSVSDVLAEADNVLRIASLVKHPTTKDAVLLDQITDIIRRYVFMGHDEALLTTLFVAHTWCVEAAEFTPYLHLRSAMPRSGKSRLLDVLEFLVARPLRIHDPTPAAITDILWFAQIFNQPPPTILWDEIDNAYKRWMGLREVVNSGFQRGASVSRAGLVRKPTFGPKVMSGLDRLPQTVFDRSFEFDMTRATSDERPTRLTPGARRALKHEVTEIRAHLEAFAERNFDTLLNSIPELPEDLDDRAQDFSEPLLAIVDIVGGDWPVKARAAMVNVRQQMYSSETTSLREKLLYDMRRVFKDREAMHTATIVDELKELEDSPWKSRRLTAWGMADMLSEFSEYPNGPRIRSCRVTINGKQKRAYRREQFEDIWRRYITDADEA